jgi:hypothetical protein
VLHLVLLWVLMWVQLALRWVQQLALQLVLLWVRQLDQLWGTSSLVPEYQVPAMQKWL